MLCDKIVCVWVCVIACDVIVCERCYVTKLWVCECVWHYCMLSFGVWSYCMSEMLCDKIVCVSVCEVIVCERCYVTKLCVWVCVKLLYVKCDKVVCVWVCVKRGGGRRRRRSPGYRIKNKNPTQSCGEKIGLKHVVSPQTTNQTSITIQKGLDSVCYIMIIMVYHGLSRYHFLCTNSKNSCANYQETSFWLLVYITCKRSIENKMPL